MMDVSFDPAKDAINKRKHGISLRAAERMDVESALFLSDASQNYGEERYTVIGFIGVTLYSLVCAFRVDQLRAISLRKATKQEEKKYAEEH